MKSLVYIVIALTLALASCSRDRQALSQMDRAEALMFDHPDSALAIMDSIPAGSLRSERARALYALLLTQARDKNYIDQTDDSLISIAVKYFDRTDDTRHRMLAYLYLGRVKLYSKNTSEAIRYLLQAEKYAREIKDTFNLAQIYGNFGEIYGEVFNAPLELKYAQMAYDLMLPWSRPDYTAWAESELARALINNFRHKEADSIVSGLLYNKKDLMKADMSLYANSLDLKATCQYALRDYHSACLYFDTLQVLGNKYSDITFYTLQSAKSHTHSCYEIGKYAKGDSIAKEYILSDSTNTAPSSTYASQGDYLGAYRATLAEYNDLAIWFKTALLQQATLSSEEFYQESIELEELRTQRYQIISIGIIIILGIFLFSAYLFMRNRMEHMKRRYSEITLLSNNLKDEISNLRNSNKNLASRINKLFSKQFNAIDRLSSAYYECRGLKNEQGKLNSEANHILKSFENINTLKQLSKLVDDNFDNLASSFLQDYPKLSEVDYLLFLYSGCGFSIRSISLFLDKSPNVLYNRKSRLKNKITASEAERKNEYLSFFSR